MERIIDPLNDGKSHVSLVQTIGSDSTIIAAARVSYGKDVIGAPVDDRGAKLIKFLLKNHHGSPLEHNLLTFRITCPIFVDRQLVRHRVGVSKNEESGRYMEVGEEFYTPYLFRTQSKKNKQVSEIAVTGEMDQGALLKLYGSAVIAASATYRCLLEGGVTREQARGILPQAMYTTSYWTFNLRSLLHLLNLRDHEGAQYETQTFARAMRALVEPLYPVTFAALAELEAEQKAREVPAAFYATTFLARELYDAYCEHAGGVNWQGLPTPLWDDLPDTVRSHWIATAEAAQTIATGG